MNSEVLFLSTGDLHFKEIRSGDLGVKVSEILTFEGFT